VFEIERYITSYLSRFPSFLLLMFVMSHCDGVLVELSCLRVERFRSADHVFRVVFGRELEGKVQELEDRQVTI
jgi:hypothetical protein